MVSLRLSMHPRWEGLRCKETWMQRNEKHPGVFLNCNVSIGSLGGAVIQVIINIWHLQVAYSQMEDQKENNDYSREIKNERINL